MDRIEIPENGENVSFWGVCWRRSVLLNVYLWEIINTMKDMLVRNDGLLMKHVLLRNTQQPILTKLHVLKRLDGALSG